MKKNIFKILPCLAILAMASGCSSELDVATSTEDTCEEVLLRLDITQEEETRGVITATKFEKGDAIRLIVASVEKPGEYYYDAKATYNGMEWEINQKINLSKYRKDGVENYTVKAVYPYDKTSNYDISSNGVTVSTMLDQTDLLYGSAANVSRGNSTAKITFKHLLSRVTLHVTNPGNEKVITGVTVKEPINSPGYLSDSSSFTLEGDIPLYLAWIFADSTAKSLYFSCDQYIPQGGSADIDVLIPPTSAIYNYWVNEIGMINGGLAFTLDTNGNPVNFTIKTPNWSSGKQYTYGVNLPQ